MTNFRSVILTVMIVLAVFIGGQSSSHAFSLLLSDGGITQDLVLSDGGSGFVNYTGAFGFWDINVSTGFNAGSSSWPYLDLNSFNFTSSQGAPPLIVAISQTDFTGPINNGAAGNFRFDVGGTTDGIVVSFNAFLDKDNTLFGMTDSLFAPFTAALGPFEDGAFSGTAFGSVPDVTTGPFSLTLASYLVPLGDIFQLASFDASVQAVPEPSVLLLLGLGLVGFAAMKSKFER